MRRLAVTVAATLVALVGFASPASADHGNWTIPRPYDIREVYDWPTSNSFIGWRVGYTYVWPCQYVITNQTGATTTLRVQFVKRSNSQIIYDVTYAGLQNGLSAAAYPGIGGVSDYYEVYMRFRWGNDAGTWWIHDLYYNSALDTNTVYAFGYYTCNL